MRPNGLDIDAWPSEHCANGKHRRANLVWDGDPLVEVVHMIDDRGGAVLDQGRREGLAARLYDMHRPSDDGILAGGKHEVRLLGVDALDDQACQEEHRLPCQCRVCPCRPLVQVLDEAPSARAKLETLGACSSPERLAHDLADLLVGDAGLGPGAHEGRLGDHAAGGGGSGVAADQPRPDRTSVSLLRRPGGAMSSCR